jgi:hypothetical protein
MGPDTQVAALRAEREAAGTTPLYELSFAEARRADLEAIRSQAAALNQSLASST